MLKIFQYLHLIFYINYTKTLMVDVDCPEYLKSLLTEKLAVFNRKIVISEEKNQHVLFTIKEIIVVTLDYYKKI